MQTQNTPHTTSSAIISPFSDRTSTVTRTTKETDVQVSLNLDGQGNCTVETGVPFLDHMFFYLW